MVERPPVTLPPPPQPPVAGRRRVSRVRVWLRRFVALLLLVGFFGLALWLGVTALGQGDEEAEPPPPPTTTAPPPPPTLRVLFPEGFTRKEMVQRVGAVRKIAQTKRKITPTLTVKGYDAASRRARIPAAFRADAKGRSEGFLFPATYEFTQKTTARELVADQVEFFEQNWAKIDLRQARTKNLTPYDVLIIASMVEEEASVARERPLVAAVIYNRL